MKPTYYSEISEGAILLHQQIHAAAEDNPDIKSLYKGCQLLYSPLIQKPKILLIGFNPGGGYFKHHGYIAENFEPMTAMEYYLNKHSLGEQTKDLFRQAGREEDLENQTVKTNFYYWATDNVADFNKLLKLLPEELSQKIFHQGRIWTKQLIDCLRPEIIVAEGFKAYDELAVLFSDKLEEEKTDSYKYFLTSENLKVIAYKRNQGNIVGKGYIKNLLKNKK
ncbi:hypothetical protein LB465_12615 [Salegentibacter sp. LM13S]|uniref:hypothetical protein n=1 Tax=Salegentibacter lacus TaxID=2873599 RepID=UPI001CCEFE8C|nr:hypothetical protein [Salegentibacter lacus]MBZ9631625.1 hypothetical protein [Salegentibacter lacus]